MQLRKGKFSKLQNYLLKCSKAWVSKVQIMWRVIYCKMVVFISSYHQGVKCHCQYTTIGCFFAAECAWNLQEVHVETVCFNWIVDLLGHVL